MIVELFEAAAAAARNENVDRFFFFDLDLLQNSPSASYSLSPSSEIRETLLSSLHSTESVACCGS